MHRDLVGNRGLLDYINENLVTIADLLVKKDVLDKVPEPVPMLEPEA